jgi:prefoldin alpha subunit
MEEEELRQMMTTLDFYRNQLESLAEEEKAVKTSLEGNTRARGTLKKYKEADEGADILVPVGGDSFVYAKVSSSERVLVGLGSGITVEKSVDSALETIDKRIEELREITKDISEKRSSMEAEHANLTQRIQEAYQEMQQKS